MSDDRSEMEAARLAGLQRRHETREARAVRKAVAEEIALAIEEARREYPSFAWNSPEFWQAMDRCAVIAREIGSRDPS